MANERILVVDDEKGVVRSCVRILERQGFTVMGHTDSQSIPSLLTKETFDLLLTDIRMPKLDGLELLRIAKGLDPHLTVILITGYGTMEDAIKAIRLGAQGFIMKPFEPADLVATIQDSLARRALIRDSMRLQTLLPLLEINQVLQVTGGETTLARRILEIARRQTKAARLAWLNYQRPQSLALTGPGQEPGPNRLVEMTVVPETTPPLIEWSTTAIAQVLRQAQPCWALSDGSLAGQIDGQPNVVGALLPLVIKGEVVGILTAEAGQPGQTTPFDPISLDLLSVLAGQLAIIVENVQLFQQAETLRAFNEDIIQTMTNGLIAIDQAGYITALNPAAAKMLDVEIEQVQLRPAVQALEPAGAGLIDIFDQVLTTGQGQTRQEITVYQHSGKAVPLAVNIAPLTRHEAGLRLVGAVAVLEDLSDIKALEAERRHLDRLAALGEMSAVVAHEIRNPIAGIAAGVEYLTRKVAGDSVESEGALMIQAEIKRVNRILEDILFVARPLQLNLAYESLPQIIDDVLHRYQPQIAASHLTVTSSHAPDLPRVKVDRQRLEQVFSNLVLNATQAVQRGQLKVTSTLADPPHQVIITISDSGPGIPAEVYHRIFEPFFTTKARGTGLGLTVARRIIEEHKGSIHIESIQNQGTSFTIKLPLTQEN
jgi:PAS domain S-box-containing protein